MMSQKITSKNIYNFFEGTSRSVLEKFGITAKHIEEQAAYRLLVCKDDCVVAGKCKSCQCKLPGRAFTSRSCNTERFPDMMNEEDWNNYKIQNKIE